jgi:protein-disulfide isomerase
MHMKNSGAGDAKKATIWFIVGFVVLVTAVLIFLGVTTSNSETSANASSTFVATTAPPITSTDWTMGSSTAPVSLIEYGDYQCPACGAYYPIVKQLLAAEGSNIFFVFRNFPLPQHPDAEAAAEAAEAAGLQGQYWPMHDLLYENQNTWSQALPSDVAADYFNGYASSLGLNVAKFDADMNSSQVANKIANDVAGGNAASINHTPTFFVNLTQIPNPASYDDFKSVIDQAIASSTS